MTTTRRIRRGGGIGFGGGGSSGDLEVEALFSDNSPNPDWSLSCPPGNGTFRIQITGGTSPYNISVNYPGLAAVDLGGGLYQLQTNDSITGGNKAFGAMGWKAFELCSIASVYCNTYRCDSSLYPGGDCCGQDPDCTTLAECPGILACGPIVCVQNPHFPNCGAPANCENDPTELQLKTYGQKVDLRTQEMIDAGCLPCFLYVGAILTVTDSIGLTIAHVLTI